MPSAAVTASLNHEQAQQNNNSQHNQTQADPSSSLRVSHSYRTKAEMLANSHIPVSATQSVQPPTTNTATSTVGTAATYLTSTLNSNQSIGNSIKSQSAAPIKQTDNVNSNMSQSMQRSELRPRFVIFLYFMLEFFLVFLDFFFIYNFFNCLFFYYLKKNSTLGILMCNQLLFRVLFFSYSS